MRALAPAGSDPVNAFTARSQLQAVAAELVSELGQLISRGLETICITGIPDVGLIPRYDVDGNGVIDDVPHAGETTSEAERQPVKVSF